MIPWLKVFLLNAQAELTRLLKIEILTHYLARFMRTVTIEPSSVAMISLYPWAL